jgi:hypothetical protein
MAIEQRVAGGRRENQGWAAKPDVSLWVRALGSHSIVDVLRAHIEPPHIDVRVRGLEAGLEKREQISTVWAVDDQRSPVIARASGEERQKVRGA